MSATTELVDIAAYLRRQFGACQERGEDHERRAAAAEAAAEQRQQQGLARMAQHRRRVACVCRELAELEVEHGLRWHALALLIEAASGQQEVSPDGVAAASRRLAAHMDRTAVAVRVPTTTTEGSTDGHT
jgi:hypothetical protein